MVLKKKKRKEIIVQDKFKCTMYDTLKYFFKTYSLWGNLSANPSVCINKSICSIVFVIVCYLGEKKL